LATSLILAIFIPYGVLLALGRDFLKPLPLSDTCKRFLLAAVSVSKEQGRKISRSGGEDEHDGTPRDMPRQENSVKVFARLFGALVLIVLGSTALVRSTTRLTAGWLPHYMLGTVVLAVLTGIPNLYTATRLARRRRGSAVMTEAMNSNSLNILAGLAIPSLVFGSLVAHTARDTLIHGGCY
jgi:Ca2+/Na+ antiporter